MSDRTWRTLEDLDPSRMYFIPMGVGNAFTDRHFHSSFILIAGCQPVLVDAPAPLRRMVRTAAVRSSVAIDILSIDHLILTHLHGDHCNGVEEYAFIKKYMDSGRRPHLYILPELIGPLWDNRLKAAMGGKSRETGEDRKLDDFFDVHAWEPGPSHRLDNGPAIHVETRRTLHSLPCQALRITFGKYRLGYSADTQFDPALISFLEPCDMIIHEAAEDNAAAVHTPLSKLEQLPEAIRRKIRLIHYRDDLTTEDTSMALLREGMLYEVRPSGEKSEIPPTYPPRNR